MAVTTSHGTLAHLLTLTDDRLYEILEGELVVFSAPDDAHMSVVIELVSWLLEMQRAGYGRVGTAPRAVALDFPEHGLQSVDVLQPDVFFVRRDRLALLRERAVQGAPDLVIEVLSPTTRTDDLPPGRKWQAYERRGVPYYWIVDTEDRSVAQFTFVDGRFEGPIALRTGDLLTCPLFPGFVRDVGDLFLPMEE